MQSLSQLVPPSFSSLLCLPTVDRNLLPLHCLQTLRQLLALPLLAPRRRPSQLLASRSLPPPQRYPSGKAFLLVPPSKKFKRLYATTGNPAAAPLIAPPPSCRLSRHFRAKDFCPPPAAGCQCARISPDLVDKLECICERLCGHSLIIVSGYRPPAYNRLYGGAPRSSHIDGLGADIRCDDVTSTPA